MLELLYDKISKKVTPVGYLIGFLIMLLLVLVVLLATKSNCSSFVSYFSPPEDEMMKSRTIEIKPLNIQKEPFNNDLPNPKVDLTAGMNADGVNESSINYSDIIATEALEKSVFDQHKAYVNEKNKVTNTASRNPARSDSQDLIPFVGLRRPQYQVAGKDMVDSTARQVPSVIDANQLAKPNNLRWN